MKTLVAMVVGGIVVLWLMRGDAERRKMVDALFPSPQGEWQQRMDREVQNAKPPVIEMPPVEGVVPNVRIDEVRAIRIWSPNNFASYAELLQAKYRWEEQHPGRATESYAQEIVLFVR